MKKKWVHIAKNHNEAVVFHRQMDLKKTPEERVSDVEFCRQQYFLMKGYKCKDLRIKKVVNIVRGAER